MTLAASGTRIVIIGAGFAGFRRRARSHSSKDAGPDRSA